MSGKRTPAAVYDSEELYNCTKDILLWRFLINVVAGVDALITVLLVFTLLIWRSDVYDMSYVDLGLYLFHLSHLLSSPAMLIINFNCINFYLINLVTVLQAYCLVGDFIVFVWRAVRLSAMVAGQPGRWLQATVMTLALLGTITAGVGTFVSIKYIRGLKYNYHAYIQIIEASVKQQATVIDNGRRALSVSFLQTKRLFIARNNLSATAGMDFMLFIATVIIRALLYYGVGLWFMPYLQLAHVFLFMWVLELAGSNLQKTPVVGGGNDASTSSSFATIVFIVLILTSVADFTIVFTSLFELLGDLGNLTVLEVAGGAITFILTVGLAVLDVWMLYNISRIRSELRLFVSIKTYEKEL